MLKLKNIHYTSGIIITIFVGLHLFNHLISVFGSKWHIEWMHALRIVYRNILAETLLIMAVLVQIISGLRMFQSRRKTARSFFEKLHIYTGLYLAVFFIFHLSAVMAGRFILQLDTNFYFGVAGLNTFPFNVFFVPYYGLAILSFFGHIASIHHRRMNRSIAGISPKKQASVILVFGLGLTLVIFYGLTNGFSGVVIPEEYGVLIGK